MKAECCLLINETIVPLSTGKHIAGFTQKKASAWQPQWTRDEALCFLRSPNNEIVVYKDGDFSAVDKRLSIAKLESFSASPGNVGANKAYPGLYIYLVQGDPEGLGPGLCCNRDDMFSHAAWAVGSYGCGLPVKGTPKIQVSITQSETFWVTL